jgi:hypothetical protein
MNLGIRRLKGNDFKDWGGMTTDLNLLMPLLCIEPSQQAASGKRQQAAAVQGGCAALGFFRFDAGKVGED